MFTLRCRMGCLNMLLGTRSANSVGWCGAGSSHRMSWRWTRGCRAKGGGTAGSRSLRQSSSTSLPHLRAHPTPSSLRRCDRALRHPGGRNRVQPVRLAHSGGRRRRRHSALHQAHKFGICSPRVSVHSCARDGLGPRAVWPRARATGADDIGGVSSALERLVLIAPVFRAEEAALGL